MPENMGSKDIARRLQDWISNRRHAGDSIGQIENAARDRFAFEMVTGEQLHRRAFTQNEREFPGEIERILNSGVHPLPAGRAVNVR